MGVARRVDIGEIQALFVTRNSHRALMLAEGSSAPDFTLKSDEGTDVTLSDFRGQNVVLFFYPKDDTSG